MRVNKSTRLILGEGRKADQSRFSVYSMDVIKGLALSRVGIGCYNLAKTAMISSLDMGRTDTELYLFHNRLENEEKDIYDDAAMLSQCRNLKEISDKGNVVIGAVMLLWKGEFDISRNEYLDDVYRRVRFYEQLGFVNRYSCDVETHPNSMTFVYDNELGNKLYKLDLIERGLPQIDFEKIGAKCIDGLTDR